MHGRAREALYQKWCPFWGVNQWNKRSSANNPPATRLPLTHSYKCPTFIYAVNLTWEMHHPSLKLHIPPIIKTPARMQPPPGSSRCFLLHGSNPSLFQANSHTALGILLKCQFVKGTFPDPLDEIRFSYFTLNNNDYTFFIICLSPLNSKFHENEDYIYSVSPLYP